MTDRPTLEDLDTAPDDGPWCCTGNAEDCALCAQQGFDMLAYPWICPGHERTTTNERIVAEATRVAAEPTVQPWTQLEARAFNAVQPALRETGEWLPLTARRKVARAVLAELQPELDGPADVREWLKGAQCGRQLAASGPPCSCGGRFPLAHLHADQHQPEEQP
ncbi:hypothetical protein ACFYWD_21180 [Streptomyces sp. NPDC003781]|uniref:hypothetical protein n=1 Tax=Streptomyces sp. NPDC003781 TaxID=3364686 RepID=UPI0036908021